MPVRCSRLAVLLALCAVAASALSQVAYTLRPSSTDNKLFVNMEFKAKGNQTVLRMPNWAPGAYIISTPYRNVSGMEATADGKPLAATQDVNAWALSTKPGQTICVAYSLPMQVVDGAVHWSGPPTYLYVDGRKTEPCTLKLDLPSEWQAATGLDELRDSPNEFKSPDYDVLADNPVTVGHFLVDSYVVRGKPHIIAMRNAAKSKVDREYLTKACKAITEMQADFFGGLPYSKFVWHFAVNDAPDGAGGLEHLNSTQIGLASGVGPRAVSVLSHEFFHLWNVKRIRSKPVGPFDYNVLPKTGALWWLEGVTDYYAHLLLVRYGWWEESMLKSDILANMRTIRSNPARLEVSPHDASYRVDETNNGRGNSNGYKISYYNLGWLCGMVLDLEIRSQTKGSKSLDDVMRALWSMCKDGKPGFAEDEIRTQCIRFGGPELGTFYDRVIMAPGELPIEDQLKKVGWEIASVEQEFVDPGFTLAPSLSDKAATIRNVHGGAEKLVKNGDVVVSINGSSLEAESNRNIAAAIAESMPGLKSGDVLKLVVRRDGKNSEVSVVAITAKRPVQQVVDRKGSSAAEAELRKGWIYAGKRPIRK